MLLETKKKLNNNSPTPATSVNVARAETETNHSIIIYEW